MLLKELFPTLRLKILNIGIKPEGREWNYKGVNSPFSRLYLVLDGEAFVRHHGEVFRLTAGTLHLVPSFTLSDYFCPERFTLAYMHFTGRLEGGSDLFNLARFQYSLAAPAGAERIWRRLHTLIPGKEINVCRPFDDDQKKVFLKNLRSPEFDGALSDWMESDGLLRQLLAPFLATAHEEGQPPSAEFMGLFGFIERNLEKNITLPMLAGQLNLHPTYFSNLFHRVVGVSPIEFVIRKRMERAQVLLLGRRARVKEVAAAVGFEDAAYFTRLFRKYTGMRPKDYGISQSQLNPGEMVAIQKLSDRSDKSDVSDGRLANSGSRRCRRARK